MKKILLILSICFSSILIAQKDNIPSSAKAAFSKSYPSASKVEWEKEGNEYEVTFVFSGKKMSANYDAKGTLTETETEIAITELPAGAAAYVKQHYKGMEIKGAAKTTKAGGEVNYEAELKGKAVIFDAQGKFIKEAKD